MAKEKQKSGGARLVESGRSPILLGVMPSDKEIIRRAAQHENRPMTQFLIYHGLRAAEKILQKIDKTS